MSSGHFREFWEHYFAPHPAREVRELFMSRAIRDLAVAMVMVFEPIYLYRQGFSIFAILGFYAAVYVVFFFLLPIGHKVARRKGYEHTMLFATPVLIIYYLSFFAIGWDWRFIFLAVVALGVQKTLYWQSYHSDFALWHKHSEAGREIADMTALLSLTRAIAPLIGGVVIALGGFSALFILVSVILVVSNIPMLATPERVIPIRTQYLPAMKRLFAKPNRRHFWTYIGYGEELIALVLWPIFIALKVPDLLTLGAIVSLAMGAKVVVTLYVGSLVDDGARMPVLRNGVVFSIGSWLIRPLVAGGLGVFLFDSFYRVSKNMTNVPLTATAYDNTQGSGGTDYIVFWEMALCLGKLAACLLGMLVFWLFPDGWWLIFILAALFSILYTLMPTEKTPFVR